MPVFDLPRPLRIRKAQEFARLFGSAPIFRSPELVVYRQEAALTRFASSSSKKKFPAPSIAMP